MKHIRDCLTLHHMSESESDTLMVVRLFLHNWELLSHWSMQHADIPFNHNEHLAYTADYRRSLYISCTRAEFILWIQ